MHGIPGIGPLTKTSSGIGTTNTDTIVTLAADADEFHKLVRIDWSYSAAPTGGQLIVSTITSPSVIVLDLDITAGGPGSVAFPDGIFPNGVTNNIGVTVTLKAGGAGVVGNLFVQHQ